MTTPRMVNTGDKIIKPIHVFEASKKINLNFCKHNLRYDR